MAKADVIVGLDIGSHSTKTVIVQLVDNGELPRVVGVGSVPSQGVRRGKIVNLEDAVEAINKSIEAAEKMAGVAVEEAVIGVGGSHIAIEHSKGVVAVGRADGEVTPDDVERVLNAAQAISIPANNEIIHVIPETYTLDDQKDIKDPVGMNGVRLEVESLIVEGSSPEMRNIAKCVNLANVQIADFVVAPLAAAESVLSKSQRELGAVAIDIGSGTTGVTVYEEGDLVHTAIIPVGAGHITNDIAIGLRTSIEVAEKVKQEFGNAVKEEVSKKEEIDLGRISESEEGTVSRYHVCEIIEARLEEIFSLVQKELKSIGKNNLLPAGAILTGGGAKLVGVVELAKNILGLPAQVGYPRQLGGIVDKVDSTDFVMPVGLVIWTLRRMDNSEVSRGVPLLRLSGSRLGGRARDTFNQLKGWFEKFMP